ncbi:MAG: PorT family protein [Tannerellaceae bacterium]|jgi:hypothetical protein|nr:PorT family protein [Tannerellaceae bacterium]
MDIERIDELEDVFRKKLRDMEAETSPDDWDNIVNRLPGGKVIPLRRRWAYWAAAVIAVLLTGGGGTYLALRTDTGIMITKQNTPDFPQKALTAPSVITPVMPEATNNQILVAAANTQSARRSVANVSVKPEEETIMTEITQDTAIPEDSGETEENTQDIPAVEPVIQTETTTSSQSTQTTNSTVTTRKWGFGMGVGGLTQNSGEVVNTYVLRGSNIEDEELLAINAPSDQNLGKLPRTNIKHRTPISFGLSVNRSLNNRFSLQTGLVYSLLISDWETQATAYNNKTRQTLHFVGVPLYLSYKITEWNRFLVYASAGIQAQVNVSGRLTVKGFSDDLQTSMSHINQRMKEWQWSAGVHTGVSYPLFPYVSAFAEIGAVYYFDNGSEIKTIYSDKAFNISPQIGFRLNF